MSEYATEGAVLQCSCGSAPAKLQVTSNELLSVQGKNVATVSDKAPMSNIPSFGSCNMQKNNPCVPSPTVWTGFITEVEIPGGNPLLNSSSIQCAIGGCIKFQNSGQMRGDRVELHPSSPQITALKKAVINETPFCEECEKTKQVKQKIRAVDVYWMEDGNEERHYDVLPNHPVTLYIETIDYEEGEVINLDLVHEEGKNFNGTKKQQVKGNVNAGGVAIIKDFKITYDKN